MNQTDILKGVIPILDQVKESLERQAGLNRCNLVLAEVAESKDAERWLVTFFYNFPGQETYVEIEVLKRSAEVLAFKRFE